MTKVRSSDGSMIDDRRGRGGGGRGGGFPGLGGGGGLPFPMKAGGGLLGLIVVIAAVVLPQLLGSGGTSSTLSSGDVTQDADAADGACSSEQEQVLCGATVDVQTYWQSALPEFFDTEYQVTQTVFFSGATSTGCGQASSQTGPFYCPLDNLVYFDLDFLVALEQQLIGKSTDLAQQYIVAHEYGHHVQNVLGTNAQVQQAQQNRPDLANQYSVALELQADCYAGVWVGDIAQRGLLESSSEIDEALAAAEGVGDDRIQQKTQGRIDPESWTHGSSQQRQDWFMRGFNTMDPTRCNTFDEVL
ncbi:MAG: neutral zinc metallopeptidase [Acidimicrobiales bacterium]|nr:neutral zinc metallopeptidase [Acidimicrobiales bacterium]MCB9393489.1 neutral zinc metallopeptidase [Acidimicrobiaceae bacterium]